MSTIQELFQQAQLAEAAYANFVAFPNNPKGALQNEGFRKGTMGSGLANCIKVPVEGFGESRGLSRAFLDTGEGMAEGR
ncbi:MAG: hypothetical protein ACREVA_05480, partial [Burkholderiales bacterium]